MSHHYPGPDFAFPRGDTRFNFADLYVFPKPGDPDKSILILNAHPAAAESEGPNYYRPVFDERAL